MIEDLQNTYFQLTYVHDQEYWQKFIYKTESLESPANEIDCSFICRNVEKNEPCDLFVFEVGDCYLGRSGHSGEGIGKTLENMTIFATENSMNAIKDNSNFAYISDVISSHWTTHLKHSHQAEIEIQVQCEAMAVIEYWHYSVFDPNEKLCYFGIISMNNFKKSGDEETTPADGSSTSEAPPLAEGELPSLSVDDSASRQVQINTAELGFFLDDFFTERSSVIYQPFTYNGFSNPLNKEHCSIQCAFDPDYKCDFWFIHHSHCYLGSFNQESGIGVHYSSETITAYIFKGTLLLLDIGPNHLVLVY